MGIGLQHQACRGLVHRQAYCVIGAKRFDTLELITTAQDVVWRVQEPPGSAYDLTQ